MTEDLSIAGPNSPISLHKFIKNHGEELKKLTVLVDGTGLGIHKDADCVYVTPEECSKQAIYYLKEKFDGEHIPAYLYRYLSYMFCDKAPVYTTDADLVKAFSEGKLSASHPDYEHILGLIRWCESNKESQQVIGMIQIIAGALRMATKAKSGIRLYLEHPETSLHPKRQSRAMSMITMLDKEYGM